MDMESDIEVIDPDNESDSDIEVCQVYDKASRLEEDLKQFQKPASAGRNEKVLEQGSRRLIPPDVRKAAVDALEDIKMRPRWKRKQVFRIQPTPFIPRARPASSSLTRETSPNEISLFSRDDLRSPLQRDNNTSLSTLSGSSPLYRRTSANLIPREGITSPPLISSSTTRSSPISKRPWSGVFAQGRSAQKQSSSSYRSSKRPCIELRNDFPTPSHYGIPLPLLTFNDSSPSLPPSIPSLHPPTPLPYFPSHSDSPRTVEDVCTMLIDAAQQINSSESRAQDDESVQNRLFLFKGPWQTFTNAVHSFSEKEKQGNGLLCDAYAALRMLFHDVWGYGRLRQYQRPFHAIDDMLNSMDSLFAAFPYQGEYKTPLSYIQDSASPTEPLYQPATTQLESCGTIPRWKYLDVWLQEDVVSSITSNKQSDQSSMPSSSSTSPSMKRLDWGQHLHIELFEYMEIQFSPTFPFIQNSHNALHPQFSRNGSSLASSSSSSSSSSSQQQDVVEPHKIVDHVQIPLGQKPFKIVVGVHGMIEREQQDSFTCLVKTLLIVNDSIRIAPRFHPPDENRCITIDSFAASMPYIQPDYSTCLTPSLTREKNRMTSIVKGAFRKLDRENKSISMKRALKLIPGLIEDHYSMKAFSESILCRVAPFAPMMDGDVIGYSWDFEKPPTSPIKEFLRALKTLGKENRHKLREIAEERNLNSRDEKKLCRFFQLSISRVDKLREGRQLELDEVQPLWEFDAITVRQIPMDDEREALRGQLGVFAIRDIQENEVIGPYVGTLRQQSQGATETTHMALALRQRYEMQMGEDLFIDSSRHGNRLNFVNDYRVCPQAEYLNDRERMNCYIQNIWTKGNVEVPIYLAAKFIPQGSEVLADYGRAYWSMENRASTLETAVDECRALAHHMANRWSLSSILHSDRGSATSSTSTSRSQSKCRSLN